MAASVQAQEVAPPAIAASSVTGHAVAGASRSRWSLLQLPLSRSHHRGLSKCGKVSEMP
jgi:hypothetical protein